MNRMAIRMASILTLTLPLAAWAAPDPQVMTLEQQVTALQVDHALALTQQQAQALLPLLQSGRTELQALQAQRQATQPALAAALTQAVSDLQSTGAISPTTSQALSAARPQPPPGGSGLRSIWQQARQILTPAQQQALATAQLGAPDRVPGDKEGWRSSRKPFRMMHVFLSDPFLALVQSRAG